MKCWTKDGLEWETKVPLAALEICAVCVQDGHLKASIRLTNGGVTRLCDVAEVDIGKTVMEAMKSMSPAELTASLYPPVEDDHYRSYP